MTPADVPALLARVTEKLGAWEASFGPFERHPSLAVDPDALGAALDRYADRLTGNYPFFHPRYAGQMLKPPHPAALVAYAAAATINPNNHALDGGPPTSAMERFTIELIRVNNRFTFAGLEFSQAEFISVILFVVGAVIVVRTTKRVAPSDAAPVAAVPAS